MPPEIAGQLKTGSPMNERQCFEGTMAGLKTARDCLRGLALLRADSRWLIPVRLLDKMIDQVTRLRDRGGARVIWLPGRD